MIWPNGPLVRLIPMEQAPLIRVLVVDDSAFMRKVIGDMVASEPGLSVVGRARNGEEALSLARKLQPDVITLDVEMPGMSGLEALKVISAEKLGRVLMLSGLTTEGAETTLEALDNGAYDFIPKPSVGVSLDMDKVREQLVEKIRMAPSINLDSPRAAPSTPRAFVKPPSAPRATGIINRLVVIGTSTGGPRALKILLPALSPADPAAYLVVQHMPKGFTTSLAQRLDKDCAIEVVEGESGLPLLPGRAIVAPGGYHMRLKPDNTVETFVGQPLNGVMPAVDITLSAAVDHFGADVISVVLTGMGKDGTQGSRRVREAGGYVLSETAETAVVYGMPRSVWEEGVSHEQRPIHEMAGRLHELTTQPARKGAPRAR